MKTPQLWLLEPAHYRIRIEICIQDRQGVRQADKTWELQHRAGESPVLLLLQMQAAWCDIKPVVEALAPNFHRLTVTVANFHGPLNTWSGKGQDIRTIERQASAYPLSLVVSITQTGLHIGLYTAKPKS